MSQGLKSLSQIWGKSQDTSEEAGIASSRTSRRQLSRQFNSAVVDNGPTRTLRSRNVLSSINLNVDVPKETRKLIQAGAEKVSSTLNGVRSTIDTWTQKLKGPTRRRQRLINGSSPYTPGRSGKSTPKSKQLLGRTPTKLYSPFGIETPSDRRQRNHQQLYGKPGTYTPTRSGKTPNKHLARPAFDAKCMYSPTQAFPQDVQNCRQGVDDFNRAAEGVVRRSLRHQMSSTHVQ